MPHTHAVACKSCALYRLCLPTSISDDELASLDELVIRHPPIEKGQQWIRSGTAFESIYSVRSGSIKLSRIDADGNERIAGLYFPGELIGLDAIATGQHACTATAVETASVCEIPFHVLERHAARIPELGRQLVQFMSREMNRDRALISTLSHKTADQRIAWLLLRIARSMERRGGSPHEFVLSLTRHEIGDYLGLAVETVSRVFTRLNGGGLLHAEGKNVRVNDIERLERLAYECATK